MTPKQLIRKVVIAAIGFPLVIVGLILMPLPGPGSLVVIAGLLVLASEFAWAERLAAALKDGVGRFFQGLRDRLKR